VKVDPALHPVEPIGHGRRQPFAHEVGLELRQIEQEPIVGRPVVLELGIAGLAHPLLLLGELVPEQAFQFREGAGQPLQIAHPRSQEHRLDPHHQLPVVGVEIRDSDRGVRVRGLGHGGSDRPNGARNCSAWANVGSTYLRQIRPAVLRSRRVASTPRPEETRATRGWVARSAHAGRGPWSPVPYPAGTRARKYDSPSICSTSK
jgi:hypothetical protein